MKLLKKLTRNELKNIKGGLIEPPTNTSCCSVKCPGGKIEERECGNGVMCTTSGTTIYCGDNGVQMCH